MTCKCKRTRITQSADPSDRVNHNAVASPTEKEERQDFSQDIEAADKAQSHRPKEPLPLVRPYLWSSAITDHENKEFRFSGFEPCYLACIKDLEWQIKRKAQTIDTWSDNFGLTEDMAPLLLRYSELISALETIESKDRVFEEDVLKSDDVLSRFSGQKRRIFRATKDGDRVHDHLRQNLILVVLGYVYQWDVADKLKRRFGNLTDTMDRVLVGVAGGASLLVPMIMMVFLTSRTARLVIVSVATMLFAILVSLMSVSRDAVIGSTAAYAAIMVVFIGSSG